MNKNEKSKVTFQRQNCSPRLPHFFTRLRLSENNGLPRNFFVRLALAAGGRRRHAMLVERQEEDAAGDLDRIFLKISV